MSKLTAAQIQTITDREAEGLAHAHLANGWDPSGDTYNLGSFLPDLERLEDAIGRTATRDERIDLERMIRDYLVTLPRSQSMSDGNT